MCCVLADHHDYFVVLYLLHTELTSAFYSIKKHESLMTKLALWEWQIDIIYENSESMLKDPLLIALSLLVKKTNLPRSLMESYFHSYKEFLHKIENFSLTDLENFAKNTCGAILQMLLFVSKMDNREHDINIHIGTAWGLITAIRNSGLNGRFYIPNDVLSTFSLKKDELSKNTTMTKEALKFIAERATTHLDIASSILNKTLDERYDHILSNLVILRFHAQRTKNGKKAQHHAATTSFMKAAITHQIRLIKRKSTQLIYRKK